MFALFLRLSLFCNLPIIAIIMICSHIGQLLPCESIAFIQGRQSESRLIVRDMCLNIEHSLTQPNRRDTIFRWSPDGTKIAYISGWQFWQYLMVMDVDGSNRRQIAANTGFPVWLPDSSGLVYPQLADNNVADIFYLSLDSPNTTPQNISNASVLHDEYPDISPDGTQVIFGRWQGAETDLFIMNLDGTNQRPFLEMAGSQRAPAWSPDGSRIAFVSNHTGKPQVHVIQADGTEMQMLRTGDSHIFQQLHWSDDSEWLYFHDALLNLVGYHIPTENIRRIEHDANSTGVQLSPNGEQLLFQSRGDLYPVQPDNTIMRLLTQHDMFIPGAAWRPR